MHDGQAQNGDCLQWQIVDLFQCVERLHELGTASMRKMVSKGTLLAVPRLDKALAFQVHLKVPLQAALRDLVTQKFWPALPIACQHAEQMPSSHRPRVSQDVCIINMMANACTGGLAGAAGAAAAAPDGVRAVTGAHKGRCAFRSYCQSSMAVHAP